MTKFILVRHGQTEWNLSGRYQGQSDIELSPVGLKQAEILAEHFPVDKIDAIYSSDLKRAFVTAEKVGKKYKCPVIKEPAFREICFGDWEGLTYEQITKKWPYALADFFQRPDILDIPNGESFLNVQKRAVNKIKELAVSHKDETLAVFAHGAIIRTVLAAAVNSPLRYLWSFRQDNTAVNIIIYDCEGFMLQLANSTEHLRGSAYQILTKI